MRACSSTKSTVLLSRGVLGLFIANSLALTVVFRMRAAKTTAQVREWMSANSALEKILPVSALLILASGLYMTFTAWGWGQAWIDLSLGLLIVLGVLGPAINERRLKAIHLAVEVAPDGPVPASLQKLISDPVLRAYALIPGFMALGVVGLMTLKLDWIGSGVVMVMAFVVSLISGQLSRGTTHKAQDEAEDFCCQNKGTWSRISKTTGRRQRSTVVEPCPL